MNDTSYTCSKNQLINFNDNSNLIMVSNSYTDQTPSIVVNDDSTITLSDNSMIDTSNFNTNGKPKVTLNGSSKLIASSSIQLNGSTTLLISDNTFMSTPTFSLIDKTNVQFKNNAMVNITKLNCISNTVLVINDSSIVESQSDITLFNSSKIFLDANALLNTQGNLLMNGDATLTISTNSSFNSSGGLELYNKSYITIKGKATMNTSTQVNLYNSSKLLIKEYAVMNLNEMLYLNNDSSVILNDEAKINSNSSVTALKFVKIMLTNNTSINVMNYINLSGNSKITMVNSAQMHIYKVFIGGENSGLIMKDDSYVQSNTTFSLHIFSSLTLEGNAKLFAVELLDFYHTVTATVNDNASIISLEQIKFGINAIGTFKNNTKIESQNIYTNGYAKLTLINNATFTSTSECKFFDKTKIFFEGNAKAILSYLLVSNSATLSMKEYSTIEATNNVNFETTSTITIDNNSKMFVNGNIIIKNSSQLNMYNFSYVSTNSNCYLSENATIRILNYSTFVVKNIFEMIAGVIEFGDESYFNTSQFILKTKGKFNLKGNNNNLLIPKIETNVLNCYNGGEINIFSNSVYYSESASFDNVTINLFLRTIKNFPLIFTYNVTSFNNVNPNATDFDLFYSETPYTGTLPNNTQLLLNGKLLRYGSSKKIFCHLYNFDLTTQKMMFFESYCPCEDTEDWYITPFDNVTAFAIESHKQKTTKNEIQEDDEFSSESATIGNNKISFYSANDVTVVGIKSSEVVSAELKSLTKKVLFVAETKISYNEFVCNAAYYTESIFQCVYGVECLTGYYNTTTKKCEPCEDIICISCGTQPNTCIHCKPNYILSDGKCEEITNCVSFGPNRCKRCSSGFVLKGATCVKGENCLLTKGDGKCAICNITNGYMLKKGECVTVDENSDTINSNNILSCFNGYLYNSTMCVKCNEIDPNAEYCENGKITKCAAKSEMTINGKCEKISCEIPNDENGRCENDILKCSYLLNKQCVECEIGKFLTNNMCVEKAENNCVLQNGLTCKRCDDSYYFDNDTQRCEKCDDNCLTCFETPTKCISCGNDTFMSDYKCDSNEELNHKCDQIASVTSGCIVCKDGYFKTGMNCFECAEKCSTCNNENSCLTCNTIYYKTNNGDCLPKSNIIGCGVEVTQSGCSKCGDGYFQVNTNECQKCDSSCLTCNLYSTKCTLCDSSLVLLSNGSCVGLFNIAECNQIKNSKCVKCSFWNIPNDDGTLCESHVVWWVILLGVIFVIIVLIIITILIVFITKIVLDRKHQKDIEKTTTLFKMDKSNIHFVSITKGICVSSELVDFNIESSEIPVNEESQAMICVGNELKNVIKVQFTILTNINKFIFKVEPEVVLIKRGCACEFSLYLTPLCTCKINTTIQIISKNLKTGEENYNTITINAVTSQSTRIDYDELVEEKKIGEGSFGVVYKGTFRNKPVAIKKMKNSIDKKGSEPGTNSSTKPKKDKSTTRKTATEAKNDSSKNKTANAREEFEKEVAMLDKFRCEYIIHFYGACFMPNKICMVTEYAQYGSLQDLMKHKKSDEIDMKLRIKVMFDAAKGISYLHNNGILHRDIKPDNMLIFMLEITEEANAKLTDFGSSRNINMMMTNMTFTKNIGTPKYMAPEIWKIR
ncbi:protein serine/threonine kinase, putative, partial [Entamoeba invadens IP1]